VSTQRERYYVRAPIFDPDPDPFIVATSTIIALVLGAVGIGLWTNKGVLNNIIVALNPGILELEEKRIESQKDAYRSMVLIIALIVIAIGIFLYWRGKTEEGILKRERRAQRRVYRKRVRS